MVGDDGQPARARAGAEAEDRARDAESLERVCELAALHDVCRSSLQRRHRPAPLRGTRLAASDAVSSERVPAVVMGDLTLVRALGAAGIASIAVARDAGDPTLWSRFVVGSCVVGSLDHDARGRTIATLVELGDELAAAHGKRAPLIFGTDAQLAFVHAHRATLARRFAMVLNDDALSASLRDKLRFHAIAAAAGVRVPATAAGDEDAAIDALRPPLVVKPRAKVAWTDLRRALFDGAAKARVFEDARALRACDAFTANRDAVIVQELVPLGDGALVSFHGFRDRRGRLLAWFCGRKVRTYPAIAGESALIELARDDEVERLGRHAIEALDVRGPFRIDMARDARDGTLWVLEVNARFTLWAYLGAAHGVNLPAVAYDYLVEGRDEARTIDYEPRVRWLNFWRDRMAWREERDRGPMAFARWARSIAIGPKVYESFAWDDPAPFVAIAGKALRDKAQALRGRRAPWD